MSDEPVVIRPRTMAEIEQAIAEHQVAITSLRREGAHIMGNEKAGGAEVLDWLAETGMKDMDARKLLVDIIKERRQQRLRVSS